MFRINCLKLLKELEFGLSDLGDNPVCDELELE